MEAITDDDLDAAVAAGILRGEDAARLRAFAAERRTAPAADEEHFHLVSSFNDIFVSIAAVLLLLSLAWLSDIVHPAVSGIMIAAASWGFAEYFTRRRHMALPSIVLLLGLVTGMFICGTYLLGDRTSFWSADGDDPSLRAGIGAGLAVIAAYLHWRRFHVPITVAAGTGAAIVLIGSLAIGVYPVIGPWIEPFLLVCGAAVFALAMWWDMSDRARVTRRSDVAFWLHLLSAPLIIHPLFSMLGMIEPGQSTVPRAILAVVIYLALALVALAIDRRAGLVSGLAYVLYATASLFRAAGSLSEATALTALTIGGALLLLSAFWHDARKLVIALLPASWRARLPAS